MVVALAVPIVSIWIALMGLRVYAGMANVRVSPTDKKYR